MKLKNSYILLIAMSLFLLISIGSVCASDTAMDADVQLADDGSIDVLSDNSTSADATEDTTQQKISTSVVSEDTTINEKETANIPVTVKDNESQIIDIKAGDLNVTESNKALKFNYANSSIILSDMAAGKHNIVITYLGNGNYTNSSTKMTLSVIGDKIIDASTVKVNSTKKAVVPIKLTDRVNEFDINKNNLTLILSYKDGNDTKTVNIDDFEFINKKLYFDYNLDLSTCNLIINYKDGNNTISKNVTVNRIYNIKINVLSNETEYSVGNFTFQILDIDDNLAPLANKSITLSGNKNSTQLYWMTTSSSGSISISSSTTLKSDENGIVTLVNKDFYPGLVISTYVYAPVGEYSITLKGSGDAEGSSTVKLNIIKTTIDIVVNPYKEYYGSTKQVIINVTNAKTGEPMPGIILHLYMPSTTAKDFYFQTDNNGTSKINVSGLVAGTYQMTVSNNDTSNVNEKSINSSITIVAKPAKMKATFASPVYYNSGALATVKITDKTTGKVIPGAIVLVQVFTGSKSTAYLYQANDKGVVTISYAPMAIGKHKIVISSADSRYSASSITKTITVKKASAKITAAKVTGYYKSGKVFTIKLTNTKNKKAIYGAKLNIKIFISSNRYYNYNGQTGLDGKLKISLDSFKPGTYKVVVSKGESKNFTAKQVSSQFVLKKAPVKFTPKKLTAKKGASKYFQITVKNTKTKKVVSSGVKVKIKVYTGKTSKTYTVKTNAKGIAKLNVKSLKVGTHKVVVSRGTTYITAKSATSSIKITK